MGYLTPMCNMLYTTYKTVHLLEFQTACDGLFDVSFNLTDWST